MEEEKEGRGAKRAKLEERKKKANVCLTKINGLFSRDEQCWDKDNAFQGGWEMGKREHENGNLVRITHKVKRRGRKGMR